MSNLSLFQFEDQEVRFVDGKPVANDVAKVLGYADSANAVNRIVDKDYKGLVDLQTPSGMQKTYVLEEAGIYQLIFKSKLPSAKGFQEWVFEEVLPSIRKTGKYEVNPQPILPPDEVAVKVAHNIRDITDTLEDQPKLAQFLIDHAISHLITEKNAQITGVELKGITEIAMELGYTVTTKNRSTLGRFCSKQLSELAVTEKRLVNGQLREVKCYPDNEIVREVIKNFFS